MFQVNGDDPDNLQIKTVNDGHRFKETLLIPFSELLDKLSGK